jgi:hypothetical protein
MYITYYLIGENGRLGNQLFQYAAIKGLASKLNSIPVLPFGIQNRYWHGQKCLLHDLFDLNIKIKNIEIEYNYKIPVKKGVDDLDFFKCNPNKNINIDGFPESEYYFKHIKDEIKEEFKIKNEVKENAINYINKIKNNKKIVAIHIRRGDTLDCIDNIFSTNNLPNIQHCTETEWLLNYLRNTINKFDKNEYKFLIFSGGSRVNNNLSDIEWCEYYFNKYFPDLDVSYSKNNTDLDDFIIFTLCEDAILTSLSTFGWWGAYLINNKNKKVYVPEIKEDNDYWRTSGPNFWAEEFIMI